MNTITDFQFRPPTEADIPAVVELRNRSWRALSGNDATTEEALRNDWAMPGFDPAQDCRLAFLPDGRAVGYASLFARSPYVSYYVDVNVDPDWEMQGIGSRLTRWLEDAVSDRFSRAPDEARIVLASSILSTHSLARQLLLEHGYQLTRTFHEMDIVLESAPPAPAFPDGIVIKVFDAECDQEAAYRAHHDAFADHFGYVPVSFEEGFPQWWHHMTEHPHYDPSCFYLAMAGEEVAGYIFCYLKDYEMPDLAWVDTLGVRRQWRQRGLGLALLQHAFGEMYQRGQKRVGLAVDADSLTGATRLYEKAGMKTFRQFNRYTKEMRAGVDLMRK